MRIFWALMKAIRLAILRKAIRIVEKAGLAVVKIQRGEGCCYVVGSNGMYVRYDKVAKEKSAVSSECRINPLYRGPSNCNRGTVGCTMPEHRP